jgi:hypothetical protein
MTKSKSKAKLSPVTPQSEPTPNPQPPKEKKATAADRVCQIYCDAFFIDANPTVQDIQATLTENKLHMSEDMIAAYKRDVRRILGYLKEKSRLKL